mgnify:CR=1 FL=1
MRVLFDHGTPVPLRRALTNHTVSTAESIRRFRIVPGDPVTRIARAEGLTLEQRDATLALRRLHLELERLDALVERAIAGIWAEVLDVERVGRDDDFFPRAGKYGHAAAFPLVAGRLLAAGALDVNFHAWAGAGAIDAAAPAWLGAPAAASSGRGLDEGGTARGTARSRRSGYCSSAACSEAQSKSSSE